MKAEHADTLIVAGLLAISLLGWVTSFALKRVADHLDSKDLARKHQVD